MLPPLGLRSDHTAHAQCREEALKDRDQAGKGLEPPTEAGWSTALSQGQGAELKPATPALGVGPYAHFSPRTVSPRAPGEGLVCWALC